MHFLKALVMIIYRQILPKFLCAIRSMAVCQCDNKLDNKFDVEKKPIELYPTSCRTTLTVCQRMRGPAHTRPR